MKQTIKQIIKEMIDKNQSKNDVLLSLKDNGFKINTIKWYYNQITNQNKKNNETTK